MDLLHPRSFVVVPDQAKSARFSTHVALPSLGSTQTRRNTICGPRVGALKKGGSGTAPIDCHRSAQLRQRRPSTSTVASLELHPKRPTTIYNAALSSQYGRAL